MTSECTPGDIRLSEKNWVIVLGSDHRKPL